MKNFIEETNFVKLCQRTLAVCNLERFPDGTFSNAGNNWLELAKAWETLLMDGSAGIFYDAVHRIMWGIPHAKSRPEYDGIVQIVVEELLKDGAAFEAWDSYEPCNITIAEVESEMNPATKNSDEYCSSIEHYHYCSDKLLWKVRYSKAKYAAEYSEYQKAYLMYEEAIKKIVPAACTWAEDYWYKEDHIYDELINLYGVDYRENFEEYGRILLLLMNAEEEPEKYALNEAWFATNIQRMPMSLAKVIWPENTEEKIIKIFLLAAEITRALADAGVNFEARKAREFHPVGVFEYKSLRNSWVYDIVNEWFANSDSSDELVSDIKCWLFTIAMRS